MHAACNDNIDGGSCSRNGDDGLTEVLLGPAMYFTIGQQALPERVTVYGTPALVWSNRGWAE